MSAAGASVQDEDIKALLMLVEAISNRSNGFNRNENANIKSFEERLEGLERRVGMLEEIVLGKAGSLKPAEQCPMQENSPAEKSKPMPEGTQEGRYVYCIADGGEEATFGRIGIEGNEVYTVSYKDICAVVHPCPQQPYNSKDQETVKNWVIAHESVVEESWKRFGTVVPVTFNVIVKGGDDSVRRWLMTEYERYRGLLEKFRSKEEYGVQIFMEAESLRKIAEEDEEVKRLMKEVKAKPSGAAYFYREKLKKLLEDKSKVKMEEMFKEFYDRIRPCADDVRVEKTKDAEGKIMIANLSLLVGTDKLDRLRETLTEISGRNGVHVRFTGPWPPYSFTS
ncbi:MAG: GvpL/GvpF family gas vesicle protein [Candidatus Bathyarchaeota archaeon]|nr:GvpL/GvpF family gas vesicle protein [Candidatus Bathyarchaeota archaeon]